MSSTSSLPTCSCGHNRTDPIVTPEPTYGFWAWILLLAGATGTPKKITYRCQRCYEVVEVTRNPSLLRSYR